MRCADRFHGFSLIEMLVALAVLSLAVLGLLNLSGENTRSAVIIHERVMAGVVAENRAVEAMIQPFRLLGTETAGVESAGDLDWRWTRTLRETDDAGIVRVDIEVRPLHEERIAAELSMFRGVAP